jgi:hypothetical protein
MTKALEIAMLVLAPLAAGLATEYLFERLRRWRAGRDG